MEFFSWNALTSFSSLVALVIKGLKSNFIWQGTYPNIHTTIGNMTVCGSNGVPYQMAEFGIAVY